MSSDDPILQRTLCAFERLFGADPDPSPPGSNSLKYTSATAASGRTGDDGNTPGPGLQGQPEFLTLSSGTIVRYRLTEQHTGIWCAWSGRLGGWGASRQAAIEDLRTVLEGQHR